jgi:hypothetical protein
MVYSLPSDVLIKSPADCPVEYSIYQIQPPATGAGGNAVTVRESDGQVTFYYTSLDLIEGKAYEYFTVLIKAQMPNGAAVVVPFYLKLSSPCMDPNLISLTVPDLEPIVYNIGSPSTYTIPEVTVNASPEIAALCGPVVTVGTFVGRDLPDATYTFVTYDKNSRTFTVNSADGNLNGMSTKYGLRAYLPGYDPGVVANAIYDTKNADISFKNACTNPDSMSFGQAQHISSDYSGAVSWNPPVLSVAPSACGSSVVYSCSFNNHGLSVANQVDLCSMNYSYGSYVSSSSFDPNTGVFTFSTQDQTNFPPGNYDFTVTATIGQTSTDVTFTMSLTNPCAQATVSIANDPFEDSYTYVLRESALQIPFVRTSIGSSSTQVDCGAPVLTFMTSTGSTTLDSIIRVDGTYQKLVIGSSFDITKAKEYRLKFKLHYANAPTRYAYSKTFSIHVVDACDPPSWYGSLPTITASSMTD